MADPLSIAGSVVGITAAGVQASVKLYALAEKVRTASERVTNIADDVSSTCAILNQVRELIIPQPDAQGTLKSVFNSDALNDISHALQRCRSVFTEIESLSRRAFEQVGKRPSLHSKIELSTIQKAKWPFLQPQFAELREDMREAKGNLVLMIAVASLALAQRDGRQRPIHENEKLELGSTIVALQRARISKPNNRVTSSNSQNRKWGLGRLFGKPKDVDTDSDTVSVRQIRDISERSIQEPMKADPPASQHDVDLAPPRKKARVLTFSQSSFSDEDTSGVSPNRNEPRPAQQILSIGDINSFKEAAPPNPFMALSVAQPIPWASSGPANFDRALPSITPAPEAMSNQVYRYHGWTTDYLQGLVTGRGDSVQLSQLALPDQSLQSLVRTYTEDGQDPYITMSELTTEQQNVIKQSFSTHSGEELAYVSSRDATVSSIFGTLKIEKIRWVVASKETRPEAPVGDVTAPFIPLIMTSASYTEDTRDFHIPNLTSCDRLTSSPGGSPIFSPTQRFSTSPSLSEMSHIAQRSDSPAARDTIVESDPLSLPEHAHTLRRVAPRDVYAASDASDSSDSGDASDSCRVVLRKRTRSNVIDSPSPDEDEVVNELLARWTNS